MFPDDLLERNQAFTFRRTARPLPAAAPIRLGVVTCFDPRLDPLLRPALGLSEGEGFFLRTAGARVAPASSSLRDLALAVFMFSLREVFVLGHSSCKMAAFDSNTFVDAFRQRDVPREAFGNESLRSWAGAIASPRQGVLGTASAIASAPFMPRDLAIAGGVLDDTTGKIDLVLKPDEPIPGTLPGMLPGRVETPSDSGKEAHAAHSEVPPPPPDLSPSMQSVYAAVGQLASRTDMDAPLVRLREGLHNESHPLRQLALLQNFTQTGAVDSGELREAFGELRQEVQAQGPDFLTEAFASLLHGKAS